MADTPVDVNTDDLNAFNDLLNGNAPAAEPKADPVADPEPKVDPVDDADAPDGGSDPDDTQEDVDADAPEGEDDGDADEGEPKGEDEEDDADNIFKPKKKPSAKERINELTREKHEAARAFEARIAALEAKLTAPKQEEAPAPQARRPAVDHDAPHPEAVNDDGSLVYPLGEFDPQFIADRTDYLFDKRMAEVDARRAEEAAAASRSAEDTARMTKWNEKLTKAEEGISDLRPTIATLDAKFGNLDPTYGVYLAQTIMDMDSGPEVLFYLANNPDEAEAIVASGPQRATLALGKLEARIQSALAKKTATPPRSTNAPKPPVTTRGTGANSSVRGDTDDLDAFERQLFNKK